MPMQGFLARVRSGSARVGVIGLGYVGLPLAVAFGARFATIGFDVNAERVRTINAGRSPVGDVDSEELSALVSAGKLRATSDFDELAACDAIIICVPTPLDRTREPDLSFIITAVEEIAKRLRPAQLVVLESTTYPGTTDEVVLPILTKAAAGWIKDFWLAFSPERIDPGNRQFALRQIPKIVGGCSPQSTKLAAALYEQIIDVIYPVSCAATAETAKLLENMFRAVNIALVNETALMCYHLGIDTHEVLSAAGSKPFGFMQFRPGPGVGGQCIPLDPLYFSWKAKQHGFHPRFIALADEINSSMPDHVGRLVADALNDLGKPVRGARILVVGVAYKPNVEDTRNSPALTVMSRLSASGAHVRYYDPYVPRLSSDDFQAPRGALIRWDVEYKRRAVQDVPPHETSPNVRSRHRPAPLSSVKLTDHELQAADCVLIATAHSGIDYERIGRLSRLVVDACNVMRRDQAKNLVSL